MKKKLFISLTGVIRGILDNKLDNPELGQRIIQRESHLEYQSSGEWEARLPHTNELIASGATRQEVLTKEIEFVEKKLEDEIRQSTSTVGSRDNPAC